MEAELAVLTNKLEVMKVEERKEKKSNADESVIQELKVRIIHISTIS